MSEPMTARWHRSAAAGAALLVVSAVVGVGPASAQGPGSGLAVRAVDALEAEGRLQEAAWAARAAGDTVRGETLLARLELILLSAPRTAHPLGMDSQGVSFTFKLDHGQGVGSIFKVDGSDIFCRQCGADREVASYGIDRLLGLDLTPMTVRSRVVDATGDTLEGSIMYFVRDAGEPREMGITKPDLLRFFDAVIGNSDRHAGNWLILPDGRVAAIDHNRAFQYRPPSPPKTCWETEVDSIRRPGELGLPFQRYRELPDDSLVAAVAGLDPELMERFVAMRPRVVERITERIRAPGRVAPRTDCLFDE